MQEDQQSDTIDLPQSLQSVTITATLTPKLNLAFHQNAVPVLRELILTNDGAQPLQALELTLTSDPPFLKSKTWHVDALGAGQRYHLPNLDVALDGALLGRLTEAEAAQLQFILRAQGEDIAHHVAQVELLARNQWGGIGHLPEMVAAFVQPNDPAIDRLLKKAAEILRQHGKSGALDGTQGGPRRVWELASAIWGAVAAMGLDYALPPASFEYAGQKIRSPSQIAEAGLATCLDSTLLFCAALEQCGLNPLIVFTHGHAFAGVWLKAEEFTTAVVDDVTALRKRVKLGEQMLFETTLATHRPIPSFSHAVERAARQISEAEEDRFELAIELRRARLQRIRPLASEQSGTREGDVTPAEAQEPMFEEAPDLPDDEIVRAEEADPKPQDRLDRWQRKLLDLSLRNNLLNFRATRKAIRLDAPDPGRLEDLLADGQALRLQPRPDLMEGNDPRSLAIHEARTNEDIHRAHALDALARGEVLVGLAQEELDGRLVDLYRSARSTLQEGGANTLYLALGFLAWTRDGTRDGKDDKRYRAPLILVPVVLNRKSVRSGFTLVLHDDEPRFNPTLIEMLRQDFKLDLAVTQGELPKDDHGLDIAGIWKQVAKAVKDIKGWEVTEDVVLATFSFAKYLMWKDLVDRTDQLKHNPVVRHLIDTPRDPYPSGVAFPNPRTLDATHLPQQTFCPLPADSSQLSAVMAAAKGKDFVLVGPPGTGKSQTIANLIAQCLAEQKTVLFASEKIAALDVVYRRLRDVGLGEFCLELHSSKARKLDVLEQLRRSWDARGTVDAAEWLREAQRLKALRDHLNNFADHLHRKRRNGMTAFAAIGHIVAGRDRPDVPLSWPSPDAHDVDALDALRAVAERLDVNAQAIGDISETPLAAIAQAEWSPHWQQSLARAAGTVVPVAEALEAAAAVFRQVAGLPRPMLDRRGRDGLAALARILPGAAGRDWRFVLRPDMRTVAEALQEGRRLLTRHRDLLARMSVPWSAEVIRDVKRGLDLLAQHRETTAQLSAPYGRGVGQIDVAQLRSDWQRAAASWWPMSWLGHRRVHTTLAGFLVENQKPDLPADLERLVTLRRLESEIRTLAALGSRTAGLWAGLESRIDSLETALAFQAILSAVLAGQEWREDGLAAVADGRCGPAMAEDFQRILEVQALEKEIAGLDDLQAKTGGLWVGLKTRIDELEKALAFHQALSAAIAALARSAEEVVALKTPLEALLGHGNALLEATGAVAGAGTTYGEALARFEQAADDLAAQAGLVPADIAAAMGETPSALAARCRSLLPLVPKLHAWCAWRKVRAEAIVFGLAPLAAAVESGAVALGKVRDAFEVAYARWWLDAVVDGDDVLRSFVSAEHDKRIHDFKALDDRFTDLTRAYVRARLCSGLPDQDSVSRSSEWGLLKREMQKRRKHLPLRTLIRESPSALTTLAPCLLMSPLSIAQYLATEAAPFDVVVFDEASQIPVWDAIGAIARGKQVIMVGDPKQLPPTAFFDRAESDGDENSDVEGDLESILDECMGANLPTVNLSWHYRSRHESLIAFSNHRYYGGGLVTFPSPVTEDRAVSLQVVPNGVYEKGGARINKPEARALVADVVSRLKDPDFRASDLTVGVVTFNAEQQRLIEDLLDEERRKSPSLEAFFAEDALEPVFVKNLENVQGDERDIMYFSITYGPDLTGAVSMNFGPMNRDGGERRLNVAITRARHELRVYSSLRPEQIDLSRTQADGVRDLKHFMEFADRGPRALAEAVFGTIGDYDSPFEQAVARALADKGWQVHPQVGVSSFRIDLGIVDPDVPGRYLAGIECDGATYHRSATARDRDKLREQVLRGLGWDILRIWSTDWWINAPDALNKVNTRLDTLLEERRARRAEEVRKLADIAVSTPVIADEEPLAAEEVEVATPRWRATDDLFQGDDLMLARAPTYARQAPAAAAVLVFREADPAVTVTGVNPDIFFAVSYDEPLLAMIRHVVEVEGPVRDDVLARRIARAHGWARTGGRIKERIMALATVHVLASHEDVGVFLWPGDDTTCAVFRRPCSPDPRAVDEIALPELIALAGEVAAQGLPDDEAITVMARLAGLHKLRSAARERLATAWHEWQAASVR